MRSTSPSPTQHCRGVIAVVATTAMLTAGAVPAHADVILFTADPEGTWTAAASWNDGNGPIPGVNDIARFDHPGESRLATWLSSGPGTFVDRWVLRDGETRFRIMQAPAGVVLIAMLNESSLDPGLLIGDEAGSEASLVFEAFTAPSTLRTFTAHHGGVGWVPGSHGRLEIHRYAIRISFSGRLDVGRAGTGAVEITQASFIDAARLELGTTMTGTGTVALSAGARIDVSDACHVGGLGHGDVTLTGAAHLTCHDLMIGRTGSASGAVSIDGAGTTLLVVDDTDAGFIGEGHPSVRNGAGLFVGGFLTVGMAASGSATVDGAGSLAWIAGDVLMGTGPSPHLRVERGGRLCVDGQVKRLTTSGSFTGTLAILVSSPLQYGWEPAVTCTGGTSGVPITVALDDVLTPVRGLIVELVHSGGAPITAPSLTLPDLPHHLAWQTLTEPGRLAIRAISAADFDDDGQVGHSDLLALLAAWGACPRPPAECPPDLNGDGTVDSADLLLPSAAWGPEP